MKQQMNARRLPIPDMLRSYDNHAKPLPLNKALVEELLRRHYSRGAKSRSSALVVIGAICCGMAAIMMMYGIALWVPMSLTILVVALLLGSFGVAMIRAGKREQRNAEPNERKIVNGCYYLKEAYVTSHGPFVKPSDDCTVRDFTFTDGEALTALPGTNCDRTFDDYGITGDRCYLLYFDEEKIPFFVFDTRWWALQPDVASFVRRRP